MEAKTLPACPVETTLTLIGDKWKVLILRDLMPGTKRFGELRKSVGSVSQKVLTAQLRDMEEKGLVHREVYAEGSAPRGVQPHRPGKKPEAHPRRPAELGRGLQGEKRRPVSKRGKEATTLQTRLVGISSPTQKLKTARPCSRAVFSAARPCGCFGFPSRAVTTVTMFLKHRLCYFSRHGCHGCHASGEIFVSVIVLPE